jgi:hypothetical protein
MENAKFAYIAPAMGEVDMSADTACLCLCGSIGGSGYGT